MLSLSYKILTVDKLYPLTISRGTSASSDNLYVSVSDGTYTGLGELSPAIGKGWTSENGQAQLQALFPNGIDESWAIADVYQQMRDTKIDPPAMAALDIALWDLYGQQIGQPLYKVWGIAKRSVATSVTIGINPPEVTRERVPDILWRTGAKCLKIKLGSPEGRDHDKEHFEAARESSAPFNVQLRVDANGGWTVAEAEMMIGWLAERGVDYVEQPLVEGGEDGLPTLFKSRKLPIFVDETVKFASDVTKVAGCVDGINLKLMKCGGPTEALRIVATARAHGLQTMIGCMSESSVAIAAGAHLGSLFDYIDLDSHLNLNPDPADGAEIVDGVIVVTDRPGHGSKFVS